MNDSSPPNSPANDPGPRTWDEWPLCPQCQGRRQAICDSCEYPGDDFPLADYLEPMELSPIGRFEDGEYHESEVPGSTLRVLLMCPRCEEATAPKFYGVCQWCGHEFEEGRRITDPMADQLTPQAMWTLFGLGLFSLVSLLWFLWATKR